MDKPLLVSTIEKIIVELQNRGWQVTDYRFMAVYAGFRSLPVLVGIAIPKMANVSIGERVKLTVPVLHDILTPEERRFISGLLIYDSTEKINNDMDEREGVSRPVVEPYWPD